MLFRSRKTKSMSSPTRNAKKSKKQQKQRRLNSRTALAPPPWQAQPILQRKLRFAAAAAVANASFTYEELAGMLGNVASAATVAYHTCVNLRIKRIEMWAPVATAGIPVNVSLSFLENGVDFESPPITIADQAVSFDRPAHINCRPPKGSLADKWHIVTSSVVMFIATYPTGTVMDIDYEYIIPDYGLSVLAPSVSGQTAGNYFHRISHQFGVSTPLNFG